MNKSKILMIVGSLLLLGLFVFPMWNITLEAPQYPDAIGMDIWINKIKDHNPNDIKNINLMNHYIGMKPIPESIPEFKYFPMIAIGMAVLGVIIGFIGKRNLYLAWFIIMAILGSAGIYDFYLWEYEYGHNLDPKAAIKIPGQGYQPPLIGSKKILNFNAISMPMTGAYLMFTGMMFSLVAFALEKKEEFVKKTLKLATPLLLTFFLFSCKVEPVAINYGQDTCKFCSMTIVDRQHAAQLVNSKGKAFKYDAIECLIKDMHAKPDLEIGMVVVNDYQSGQFIPADEAHYLVSETIPSPMGANLSAFTSHEQVQETKQDAGGSIYTWDEVKEKIVN